MGAALGPHTSCKAAAGGRQCGGRKGVHLASMVGLAAPLFLVQRLKEQLARPCRPSHQTCGPVCALKQPGVFLGLAAAAWAVGTENPALGSVISGAQGQLLAMGPPPLAAAVRSR